MTSKKTKKSEVASEPDSSLLSPRSSFPIVGIGASAGGLEALELFLGNVPTGSGLAIVIVQHLDPTHKGIMVELLQRRTNMRVLQVKDRTRVEPNCVYVIPPNKDMSILHGMLHLLEPLAPRGLRLPIDFFFRSLATDQQEYSIGVILSGMGSDGTLGLRAIKEKAGVAFVQDPVSAKFNGMPHSAIEAGLADVVASVEDLPAKIIDYLQYAPLITKPGLVQDDKSESALDKVIILLRAQTGHDFSLYKRNTLYRRIERRMGLHQIERIGSYVRYLQENPQELDLLFRELLIGVTSFFRDPATWDKLKSEALPALLAGRAPNQVLRAWVPACSTGEEAYTLAILFREALDEIKPARTISLQIFATDLDQDAILKAREGTFPENIAADVSAERLGRFFIPVERGYQVSKSIREMVIFAQQNLIMDPPFTRLDMISCRNLLIYLTPELQKKLIPLFHYSLNSGGFLILGSAETVGSFTNLFTALDDRTRIYRQVTLASAYQKELVDFLAAFSSAKASLPRLEKTPASLQTQVEELLLQKYAPAAVVTNERGDILYISGRTGKYLEPASGKANWNIISMAREGLRYELSSAFQKLQHQKEALTIKNLAVGTNGGTQIVDVTIQPFDEPENLRGMLLVIFSDVALPLPSTNTGLSHRRTNSTSEQAAELGLALNRARHEVQSIREEMQTSQEELKSTNEELQSANEELQSTNEELTTSKEEMQSMNEELQTVNNELQAKVGQLSHANNDMKNLLDSTNIATLFLDNALCVRRFTSQTAKVTKLIPGDVGRPITDIASALLYPQLADETREVLRTLVKVEHEISMPDGSWFTARILPYRTLENMIDGVVITFTDITTSKMIEAELRASEVRLRELIDQK